MLITKEGRNGRGSIIGFSVIANRNWGVGKLGTGASEQLGDAPEKRRTTTVTKAGGQQIVSNPSLERVRPKKPHKAAQFNQLPSSDVELGNP